MLKSPAFSTSFLESRMIQKLKSRKSRIKPGLFAFLLAERIIFGKKTQKSSRAPCGPGWIFRECGIRTREGTRQVSLTLNLLGQEARQGFLRRGETGPTRLRVGVRASSVSQKRWSIPPAQPGVAPQAIRDHHLGGGREFLCPRFWLVRVSRQRNSAEQVERK